MPCRSLFPSRGDAGGATSIGSRHLATGSLGGERERIDLAADFLPNRYPPGQADLCGGSLCRRSPTGGGSGGGRRPWGQRQGCRSRRWVPRFRGCWAGSWSMPSCRSSAASHSGAGRRCRVRAGSCRDRTAKTSGGARGRLQTWVGPAEVFVEIGPPVAVRVVAGIDDRPEDPLRPFHERLRRGGAEVDPLHEPGRNVVRFGSRSAMSGINCPCGEPFSI